MIPTHWDAVERKNRDAILWPTTYNFINLFWFYNETRGTIFQVQMVSIPLLF